MGAFNEYLDQQRAERDARDRAAAEQREIQERTAAERKAALAKPLKEKLEPVIREAETQLAGRSIKIDKNPPIGITQKMPFQYYYYFRLEENRSGRGVNFSSIYGFTVDDDGAITGIKIRSPGSTQAPDKILMKKLPDEFGQAHVQEVIYLAIEELVNI